MRRSKGREPHEHRKGNAAIALLLGLEVAVFWVIKACPLMKLGGWKFLAYVLLCLVIGVIDQYVADQLKKLNLEHHRYTFRILVGVLGILCMFTF